MASAEENGKCLAELLCKAPNIHDLPSIEKQRKGEPLDVSEWRALDQVGWRRYVGWLLKRAIQAHPEDRMELVRGFRQEARRVQNEED